MTKSGIRRWGKKIDYSVYPVYCLFNIPHFKCAFYKKPKMELNKDAIQKSSFIPFLCFGPMCRQVYSYRSAPKICHCCCARQCGKSSQIFANLFIRSELRSHHSETRFSAKGKEPPSSGKKYKLRILIRAKFNIYRMT